MDLALLIFLPVLAALLTPVLHLNFLVSTFLFFGLPAGYLSCRKPQIIGKSLLFTILAMGAIALIMSNMAFLDQSWYTPSIWRIMRQTVSIDEIVWGLLWGYFGIVFWEYFLDHDKNKTKFSPNIRYLIAISGILLTLFLSLYFLNSPWLIQPYFYLKFGLVMVLPMIIFAIFKFPRLIRKLIALGSYFFFVSVLVEYTALKAGHWWYSGQHYLGTTAVLAGQNLAVEEIIFWFILGVPGLICWYEIFADDRK